MNHAAVGAGLPARHVLAPLEHHGAQLRTPPLELASYRQAEDAGPDDREIAFARRLGHLARLLLRHPGGQHLEVGVDHQAHHVLE